MVAPNRIYIHICVCVYTHYKPLIICESIKFFSNQKEDTIQAAGEKQSAIIAKKREQFFSLISTAPMIFIKVVLTISNLSRNSVSSSSKALGGPENEESV